MPSKAVWASTLIKMLISALGRFKEITLVLIDPNSAASVTLTRGLNSIDNLSDQDPFIRNAAKLPISQAVSYHITIGNFTPDRLLADSGDSVVPYRSSPLEGATSN